jgi:putative restriction endonuclease
MKLYVGITDREWFRYLRDINAPDMNFWRPKNASNFKAIQPGELFLFKTKHPENKIVGGAFFVRHTVLPLDIAWSAFEQENGVENFEKFKRKIQSIRSDDVNNPNIGCTILTQPFYFQDYAFQPPPKDWSGNIVSGKSYDVNADEGRRLFEMAQKSIQTLNNSSLPVSDNSVSINNPQRFGAGVLIQPRLGQGAFRALIIDEYQKKCSITGEKTLPVLEAAHIQPYSENGPHEIKNGILLRSDFHKLFDKGYITIDSDFVIHVSRRIREEFSNGKEYYAYDKRNLTILPSNPNNQPDHRYLEWHQNNRFLG